MLLVGLKVPFILLKGGLVYVYQKEGLVYEYQTEDLIHLHLLLDLEFTFRSADAKLFFYVNLG